MALDPSGRTLYVTSAGRTSGVAIFARDPATGGLTQLPGTDGCLSDGLPGCGRARGITSADEVVVAPDGRHVYIAARDGRRIGSERGGIAVFERDPATGALRQLPGRRGCSSTTGTRGACRGDRRLRSIDGLVVAPDGRTLYTTAFNGTRGPLPTPIAPDGTLSASRRAPSWPLIEETGDLAVSRDGRRLFVGSSGGLVVYERRSPARALLVRACLRSPFSPPGCPRYSHVVQGVLAIAPDETVYLAGDDGLYTARLR
jgi:6-phosphogluconolactonase (cycloisomerase 2 family)